MTIQTVLGIVFAASAAFGCLLLLADIVGKVGRR